MAEHRITIIVQGRDEGASSTLHGVGGALSNMAQIAGGVLGAQLLANIGRGLVDLGKNAIGAVSDMQNLGIALETLAARELARGQEATVSRKTVIHLTDKEKEKLKDLQLEYQTLGARMQEQKQHVWEMTNKWTEQGLATQTAKARLAEMENEYAKLGGEIDKLAGKEGKVVTVQDKVRVNTMKLADALKQAGPKAAELMARLRDLSLVSPFEYDQIAGIFRLQMAFGTASELAVDVTGAIADTAAGLGLTGDAVERLAYNFGQLQSIGKITGIDLRQLRMVGLDLADVLETELGMSVEQVNAALESGKMTMDDVSRAFVKYADENFGGAAKRMSRSLSGLKSSFGDLFTFAATDLLTPAVETVTGALGGLFDKAREVLDSGKLAEIGEDLGNLVSAVLTGDWEKLGDIGRLISPFAEAIEKLGAGDLKLAWLDLSAGIGQLAEQVGLVDTGKANDVALAIYNFGKNAGEAAGNFKSFVENLGDVAWQTALDWFAKNGEPLEEDLDGIADGAKDLAINLKDLFGTVEGKGVTAEGILSGLVEGGLGEFAIAADMAAKAVAELNTGVENWTAWLEGLKQPTDDAATKTGLLNDVIRSLPEGFRLLGSPMSQMQTQVQNWTNLNNWIVTEVPKILKKAGADVKTFFDEQMKLLAKVPGDMGKAITDGLAEVEKAGKALVAGVRAGIEEAWEGFTAWLVSRFDALIKSILDAIGAHSPADATRPIGRALALGIQDEWTRTYAAMRSSMADDVAGMFGAHGMAAPAYAYAAPQPSGRSGTTIGGDTFVFNIYDQGAMRYARAWAEERRQARLNESMGG